LGKLRNLTEISNRKKNKLKVLEKNVTTTPKITP